MSNLRATVFGATGLVGKELVQLLAEDEDYQKVYLANRREVDYSSKKLKSYVVDFDKLEEEEEVLFKVDHIFIALGTTINKAGSQAKFKAVDLGLPSRIAKLSKASKLIMVSSLGANPESSNFYLQTKGRAEEAIIEESDAVVHIVRPSLLLGDRQESRLGESIAKFFIQKLSFLLQGSLKQYRGIQARTVAQSMIFLAKNRNNAAVLESEEMKKLTQP
ncbi:MAG: NAD(P)H-binding protein [Vicingaceae bacterium]